MSRQIWALLIAGLSYRSLENVLLRTATWEEVESCGSGYLMVIQPVGDLVRVITPLATHPVCWNTPRTSPFSQRHWMHVDQFA